MESTQQKQSKSKLTKGTNVDFEVQQVDISSTQNLLGNLNPPQNKEPYFRDIVLFLQKCPIASALTLEVPMFGSYLQQFWYSSRISDSGLLCAKIHDGNTRIKISLDDFRSACGLNYLKEGEEFEDPVDDAQRRTIADMIGYEHEPDENTANFKMFKKVNMSRKWAYFFTHIIQSLGGKRGSLNQANQA